MPSTSMRCAPCWRATGGEERRPPRRAAGPRTAGRGGPCHAARRPAGPGAAALEARSTATHWIIRVREGGRERQRIEVTTDLPETAPRLADANGDGAPDLWVPVIGGNADTAWICGSCSRPRRASAGPGRTAASPSRGTGRAGWWRWARWLLRHLLCLLRHRAGWRPAGAVRHRAAARGRGAARAPRRRNSRRPPAARRLRPRTRRLPGRRLPVP